VNRSLSLKRFWPANNSLSPPDSRKKYAGMPLSPTEFMWRLSFIVGALHHTLATMHYMDDLTRGLCRGDHAEQATAHFVRFAVNTIRAPEIRE